MELARNRKRRIFVILILCLSLLLGMLAACSGSATSSNCEGVVNINSCNTTNNNNPKNNIHNSNTNSAKIVPRFEQQEQWTIVDYYVAINKDYRTTYNL